MGEIPDNAVGQSESSLLAERLSESLGGELPQGSRRARIAAGVIRLTGQKVLGILGVLSGHGLQELLHHLRLELVRRAYEPGLGSAR
jgi:hypothetical protein